MAGGLGARRSGGSSVRAALYSALYRQAVPSPKTSKPPDGPKPPRSISKLMLISSPSMSPSQGAVSGGAVADVGRDGARQLTVGRHRAHELQRHRRVGAPTKTSSAVCSLAWGSAAHPREVPRLIGGVSVVRLGRTGSGRARPAARSSPLSPNPDGSIPRDCERRSHWAHPAVALPPAQQPRHPLVQLLIRGDVGRSSRHCGLEA